MHKRQVKYNPAFLTEDQLIENFVVRHTDLDLIVRVIKENNTCSNQHLLIIGPRGIGKTTLILRVAAEVRRNSALQNRWYPLIFAEESYQVTSAGEFWLEALFHLSQQTGDTRWKETYLELREETDERRLRERSLGQLLDFADRRSQRILLMVENINTLFGELNSDDGWALRHTLINEPRIMLLATATSRFKEIEDISKPMFEMFKIQGLEPLDDNECNDIWDHIAGEPLAGEQIKPIRILTGGSPRLLVIIAQFGAHRSFRQLLDDIVDLIDDHTEYFKSHLDRLPTRERKVYLALAELWDPSTAREIATAARMDVNKTSANLKRLIGRGAVLVEDQRKKTRWYAVAERMYSIYYLMRRRGGPASRVRAAVRFMLCLYDPEKVVSLIVNEARGIIPERLGDYHLAYQETLRIAANTELQQTISSHTPQPFIESFSIQNDSKDLLTEPKEPISASSKKQMASDMLSEGLRLFLRNRYEDALALYDEVVVRFGASETATLQEVVATAMVNKGVVLSQLNRPEDALAVLDEVVARFGASEEAALQEVVAKAMVNKGVVLGRLNRSKDKIAVFDEVVARFGESKKAVLQESVAKAMVNKGVALGRLNRLEDALAVFDEVVARFGASEAAALQGSVAKAMVNKGVALGQLNRPEDKIALYDEVVARFSASEEVALQEIIAKAMLYKGVTLDQLSRPEDKIALYDEVVARFGESEAVALQEMVAKAMVNNGVTLDQLNRPEDALALYDNVVARFGASEAAVLQESVAKAMVNKGAALGQLNRPEDKIALYDEVVSRFGASKKAALQESVAKAMLYKGVTLGQLNRPEDALTVLEEAVARFGASEATVLQEQVAKAMVNKGVALGQLNRTEDALALYDEVVARFGASEAAVLQEQVAQAMLYKGVTLGRLNRLEDALAAFDEVVTRFGASEEAALQEMVAKAMVDKGATLGRLNRPEDALAVLDKVVARFGASEEAALQEMVAQAMVNKGVALGRLNRLEDALTVFDEVVARFGASKAAAFQEMVAKAMVNKGVALGRLNRPEDMIAVYDEIAARFGESKEMVLRKQAAEALNGVAWTLYRHDDPALLLKALTWARKAVALAPTPAHYLTLACICSVLGKGDEALKAAGPYIEDTTFVTTSIEAAIELFVALAASGKAKEALALLVNTPAAEHLEPLIIGLKRYLGEDVKVAYEIEEMAKEVVQRIQERGKFGKQK